MASPSSASSSSTRAQGCPSRNPPRRSDPAAPFLILFRPTQPKLPYKYGRSRATPRSLLRRGTDTTGTKNGLDHQLMGGWVVWRVPAGGHAEVWDVSVSVYSGSALLGVCSCSALLSSRLSLPLFPLPFPLADRIATHHPGTRADHATLPPPLLGGPAVFASPPRLLLSPPEEERRRRPPETERRKQDAGCTTPQKQKQKRNPRRQGLTTILVVPFSSRLVPQLLVEWDRVDLFVRRSLFVICSHYAMVVVRRRAVVRRSLSFAVVRCQPRSRSTPC
jgi:hypothetical protein